MAKKRKNSNYKPDTPRVPVQNGPVPQQKGPKRTIVTAVRWSAWILVICVILTQITGNTMEDMATLGMFALAGLLYAISLVLEKKYHW